MLNYYFFTGELKVVTGRYTIFEKQEGRSRAKEICSVSNGHLVAFETEEEYNAVVKTKNGWRIDAG